MDRLSRPSRQALGIFALSVLACGSRTHAQIRPGEMVLFFPTAARLNETGQTWLVPIHGWIYEPSRNVIVRRVALHHLSEEMELDDDAGARRTLAQRAGWLFADNKDRRQVEILLNGRRHALAPSSDDGHFEDVLELPANEVAGLAVNGRLSFQAALPDADERRFDGTVTLVPPTGVTVISDIDDTVKVTEATHHTRLLRRTFVEPFQAVAGMADRYQAWNAAGTLIWYVSSGPWQLYAPVQEFLTEAGFPSAVWDMRRANLMAPGARGTFDEHYEYKLAQLTGIINAFPERRYVLIGDSGEQDPETYGEVARRFPGLIAHIAIRDVTDQSPSAERYQSAFRDVPGERWQIFHDADEIAMPIVE